MQKRRNKRYFWDFSEKASETFRLRRLFEYASFPDLIKIPFSMVRRNIGKIELPRLRAPESRIRFLEIIKKTGQNCKSWEEAILE